MAGVEDVLVALLPERASNEVCNACDTHPASA